MYWHIFIETKKYNISKINFIRKLGKDVSATMFLIVEKQQRVILDFSLDSSVVLNEPSNSKFVTRNGKLPMISRTRIMM